MHLFILAHTPKTPSRKRKHSETVEDIHSDQERYEKRRQSAALYQKYLQRGGPKHHGSKEVPKVYIHIKYCIYLRFVFIVAFLGKTRLFRQSYLYAYRGFGFLGRS